MFWSSQNKFYILQSNNPFEMERTPNNLSTMFEFIEKLVLEISYNP
jgi:hypothetical protein